MITTIWKPQQHVISNADLGPIMRACLDAGIRMESAAERDIGFLFNFSDNSSEADIQQALTIAEAYDPVAAAAAAQAVADARAADLKPFKLIQTLIDASMRDEAAIDAATLLQLRGLLKGLFDREQMILKGMARIIERIN